MMLGRWCMAAAVVVAATPAWTQRLKAGDPAPVFEPEVWIKGESVSSFEPGHLYLIEFWATWDGPSRDRVPHLTRLQQDGRDLLTVIAVAIKDGRQDQAKVEEFVEAQGDDLDYTVAYSDARKVMEDWLLAANQRSLPCTFIVGADGKVSWIGDPAQESAFQTALQTACADVVARRNSKPQSDPSQPDKPLSERDRKKLEKLRAQIEVLEERANELLDAGEPLKAVPIIDRIVNLDEENEYEWAARKLEILLVHQKSDRPAIQYAKRLVEKMYPENAAALLAIGLAVQRAEDQETLTPIPQEVKDHADAAVLKASDLTEQKDPAYEEALAATYWRRGDKTRAIEVQRRAVELTRDPDEKEVRAKVLDTYIAG